MSKSVIDERVVQMSFDNDQFEKGVAQTINSLEKLDNGLDKISDGTYFQNMETSIKKVEQAFSASGMVINGILISIGQTINQYINKGLAALTSGIRSGMQEYETQMGATQTILANVKDEGKGIADVTAALDELNTYADKTIYNFTEMTRNIGMFTAAGANLDTSVATIKGLANAAALVGANATTAARAWYQVSQAMAAGSFKLMDWRSLEISNIAGEGFKSVLIEVARKDGVAIDELIKKYGSLRDTLKEGWLTADRFAEAMKILSGDLTKDQIVALGYTEEQAEKLHDLAEEAVNAAIKVKSFGQLIETTNEAIGSGWAVTFRTIIGDFEKARQFYTRISKVLNKVIDRVSSYRNKFLNEIWNVGGSRGIAAVKYFKKTVDNLLAIFSTFIGAIRTGFDNIFPWTRIRENMGALGEFIEDFSRKFVLNPAGSEDTSNIWNLDKINDDIKNLIKIFRGLFAGIDVILTTIGETIKWVINQIPGLSDFYNNLENGNKSVIAQLADIMDNVTKFRDIVIDMNLIPRVLNLIKQEIIRIIATNPILKGMVYLISYAVAAIKALFQVIANNPTAILNMIFGIIKLIGSAIIGLGMIVGEVINKIFSFFNGNSNFSFFKTIGDEITTFIGLMIALGNGTMTVTDVFNIYKQKVLSTFDAIMNSKFVQGIIGFFTNLWDTIKTIGENIKNTFITIGEYFTNLFEEYDVDLGKVGIFGALTGVAILLYKALKDVDGIVGLAGRFGEVLSAIANKINSEALWNLAKSVGVLAASLFLLSLIPYERLLETASVVVTVLLTFTLLTTAIKGTIDAIGAIRKATKPFEEAVTAMAKGVSAFIKKIGNAVLLEAIGDALLKVTLAIVGLALAFKFMPESMDKALTTMVVVIGVLTMLIVVFDKLTKSSIDIKRFTKNSPMKVLKNIAEAGMQFLKLAGLAIILEGLSNAILKITAAIAILSLLDPLGLLRGLGTVLLVITALTAAIALIEVASKEANPASILSISVAMIAFGSVVTALSGVAALMGLLPGDVLLKGLGTVGIIMVVLGTMISIISYNANYYAASTFLSLAAVMGAMSIGIAAIIAASSLIQNQTQLQAMTNAMIGFGVLLVVTFAAMAIMSKFDTDVTGMLAMAAVMGTLALVVVAIAGAIKMLEGVKVSDQVLNTLTGIIGILALVSLITAIMSIVIAGLGPEISVFADLALVGMAMAVAAWGYVAQSIGKCALDLAQSQIVFQDALYGWWSILVYVSSLGDTFTRTLAGAAETIINAVPNLFGFFVTVGVAIGTALSGLVLGISSMVSQIVLNICTMILNIIFQISSWINSNAELIKSALTELFTAILNLAIIALQVAFSLLIPKLLEIIVATATGLFSTIWSVISGIWIGVGQAMQGTILAPLGDLLIVLGQAIGWIAENVSNLGTIIIDKIEEVAPYIAEVVNTLDLIAGSADNATTETEELAESIVNSNTSMGESMEGFANKAAKSIDTVIANKKKEADQFNAQNGVVVDSEKFKVDEIAKTTKKQVEFSEEVAEASTESTETQINNQINLANGLSSITDGSLGDMVGQFSSFFNLNLDNQGSYIESILSNEAYLGSGMNSLTKQYLDNETNMYNEYYGNAAEAVKEYYDTRDEASKKAKSGDYAGAKDLYDDANVMMKTLEDKYKITQQDLLSDVFDYDGSGVFTSGALQKAQQDSWSSMAKDFSDMWSSYSPSDVKTDAYTADYDSSTGDITSNNDALEDELKDRNDIIGKADSEIQPKDLTPTIDLDSLKNEVNQANGIMTGSLLAAQNAAIGNYINTDSELNPFLKDRWQNVYNFTQNNYSPKALSRIDIYRQTQNQLRLSRGM